MPYSHPGQQTLVTRTSISCGVHNLNHLVYAEEDWMKVCKEVATQHCYPPNAYELLWDHDEDPEDLRSMDWCAFLVFSDAVAEGNGRKFAKYLEKHNLGKVMVTEKAKNENSGNNIEVFVWTVDWKALDKHVAVK